MIEGRDSNPDFPYFPSTENLYSGKKGVFPYDY